MSSTSFADITGVLVAHPQDNVASILSDAASKAVGVAFGHKIALQALERGSPVVKYGVVIGHATADITKGEHVHVHNCA